MTVDAPPTRATSFLLICTGNICRSPYAEFALGGALREIDPEGFVVGSAGTQALRGHPIDRSSAALLGALEQESVGFTASQLTPSGIAEHDVILTMTRQQRSAVLKLRPDALRRTFTLREFARLLDTIDPAHLPTERRARWLAALPALAANRTTARINDPAEDDVIDPYRQDLKTFRQMADQISPAITRIAAFERLSRAIAPVASHPDDVH